MPNFLIMFSRFKNNCPDIFEFMPQNNIKMNLNLETKNMLIIEEVQIFVYI